MKSKTGGTNFTVKEFLKHHSKNNYIWFKLCLSLQVIQIDHFCSMTLLKNCMKKKISGLWI